MSIVIDIILVAVVIVTIVFSAKKGIAVTLLEIVAFVAAIFLATQCAAPVASAMYTGLFQKTVQRELYDALPDNTASLSYTEKAQKVWDNVPDFAKSYAEKVGINTGSITEKLATANIADNDNTYIELEKVIVQPIAVAVLKSIMFFVMSVLFGVILRLIAKGIAKSIKKTDVLGSLDKLIGGVLGIAKGLVFVFLLCCMLKYLQPRFTNEDLKKGIDDSAIVQAAENFDPMDAITAAGVFIENSK